MSVTDKIMQRIKRKGRGWVFSSSDFLDIAPRRNISQALSRLAKKETIRRLGHGLYDYPKQSKVFGTVPPDPHDVARVLAGDEIIFPCGAKAANMLGLSTQVPAKLIYLTNGRSRKRTTNKMTITFEHAKVPLLPQLSDKTNLVLQALYWTDKNDIDDQVIRRCSKILTDEDIQALHPMMRKLPGWLADTIKRIERAI